MKQLMLCLAVILTLAVPGIARMQLAPLPMSLLITGLIKM